MQQYENVQLRKAIASSDLCALLAAAFRFPDETLADALCSGTFELDAIASLEEVGASDDDLTLVKQSFSDLSGGNDPTALLDAMRKEHTRLYDMPGVFTKIQIYEGPFRFVANGHVGKPTLFLSPVTIDVKKQMIAAGVISKKYRSEPVDSIFVELEFMKYLYAQLGKSLLEDDKAAQVEWLGHIKSFRENHFAIWAPSFMEATAKESTLAAYIQIALIARIALGYILGEND
ncbi:MAG: molecular chaperone TorD family protein [Actinobacteria bacterium]|nr:molecular chaperone TorD family protein [Actinomycetota bacterium]